MVILIDRTQSTPTIQESSQRAAIRMVQTLSVGDNVGVLTFSDRVEVLSDSDSLIPVSANIQEIEKAILDIQFDEGKADLESAFIKSLSLINNSLLQGQSGCSEAENIVLLITNGKTYFGSENEAHQLINKVSDIINHRSSWIIRMVLFIYSTG